MFSALVIVLILALVVSVTVVVARASVHRPKPAVAAYDPEAGGSDDGGSGDDNTGGGGDGSGGDGSSGSGDGGGGDGTSGDGGDSGSGDLIADQNDGEYDGGYEGDPVYTYITRPADGPEVGYPYWWFVPDHAAGEVEVRLNQEVIHHWYQEHSVCVVPGTPGVLTLHSAVYDRALSHHAVTQPADQAPVIDDAEDARVLDSYTHTVSTTANTRVKIALVSTEGETPSSVEVRTDATWQPPTYASDVTDFGIAVDGHHVVLSPRFAGTFQLFVTVRLLDATGSPWSPDAALEIKGTVQSDIITSLDDVPDEYSLGLASTSTVSVRDIVEWTRNVSSLQTGDQLVDTDGESVEVSDVVPTQGLLVTLQLSDRVTVQCTPLSLVRVSGGWVTAGSVRVGDILVGPEGDSEVTDTYIVDALFRRIDIVGAKRELSNRFEHSLPLTLRYDTSRLAKRPAVSTRAPASAAPWYLQSRAARIIDMAEPSEPSDTPYGLVPGTGGRVFALMGSIHVSFDSWRVAQMVTEVFHYLRSSDDRVDDLDAAQQAARLVMKDQMMDVEHVVDLPYREQRVYVTDQKGGAFVYTVPPAVTTFCGVQPVHSSQSVVRGWCPRTLLVFVGSTSRQVHTVALDYDDLPETVSVPHPVTAGVDWLNEQASAWSDLVSSSSWCMSQGGHIDVDAVHVACAGFGTQVTVETAGVQHQVPVESVKPGDRVVTTDAWSPHATTGAVLISQHLPVVGMYTLTLADESTAGRRSSVPGVVLTASSNCTVVTPSGHPVLVSDVAVGSAVVGLDRDGQATVRTVTSVTHHVDRRDAMWLAMDAGTPVFSSTVMGWPYGSACALTRQLLAFFRRAPDLQWRAPVQACVAAIHLARDARLALPLIQAYRAEPVAGAGALPQLPAWVSQSLHAFIQSTTQLGPATELLDGIVQTEMHGTRFNCRLSDVTTPSYLYALNLRTSAEALLAVRVEAHIGANVLSRDLYLRSAGPTGWRQSVPHVLGQRILVETPRGLEFQRVDDLSPDDVMQVVVGPIADSYSSVPPSDLELGAVRRSSMPRFRVVAAVGAADVHALLYNGVYVPIEGTGTNTSVSRVLEWADGAALGAAAGSTLAGTTVGDAAPEPAQQFVSATRWEHDAGASPATVSVGPAVTADAVQITVRGSQEDVAVVLGVDQPVLTWATEYVTMRAGHVQPGTLLMALDESGGAEPAAVVGTTPMPNTVLHTILGSRRGAVSVHGMLLPVAMGRWTVLGGDEPVMPAGWLPMPAVEQVPDAVSLQYQVAGGEVVDVVCSGHTRLALAYTEGVMQAMDLRPGDALRTAPDAHCTVIATGTPVAPVTGRILPLALGGYPHPTDVYAHWYDLLVPTVDSTDLHNATLAVQHRTATALHLRARHPSSPSPADATDPADPTDPAPLHVTWRFSDDGPWHSEHVVVDGAQVTLLVSAGFRTNDKLQVRVARSAADASVSVVHVPPLPADPRLDIWSAALTAATGTALGAGAGARWTGGRPSGLVGDRVLAARTVLAWRPGQQHVEAASAMSGPPSVGRAVEITLPGSDSETRVVVGADQPVLTFEDGRPLMAAAEVQAGMLIAVVVQGAHIEPVPVVGVRVIADAELYPVLAPQPGDAPAAVAVDGLLLVTAPPLTLPLQLPFTPGSGAGVDMDHSIVQSADGGLGGFPVAEAPVHQVRPGLLAWAPAGGLVAADVTIDAPVQGDAVYIHAAGDAHDAHVRVGRDQLVVTMAASGQRALPAHQLRVGLVVALRSPDGDGVHPVPIVHLQDAPDTPLQTLRAAGDGESAVVVNGFLLPVARPGFVAPSDWAAQPGPAGPGLDAVVYARDGSPLRLDDLSHTPAGVPTAVRGLGDRVHTATLGPPVVADVVSMRLVPAGTDQELAATVAREQLVLTFRDGPRPAHELEPGAELAWYAQPAAVTPTAATLVAAEAHTARLTRPVHASGPVVVSGLALQSVPPVDAAAFAGAQTDASPVLHAPAGAPAPAPTATPVFLHPVASVPDPVRVQCRLASGATDHVTCSGATRLVVAYTQAAVPARDLRSGDRLATAAGAACTVLAVAPAEPGPGYVVTAGAGSPEDQARAVVHWKFVVAAPNSAYEVPAATVTVQARTHEGLRIRPVQPPVTWTTAAGATGVAQDVDSIPARHVATGEQVEMS